MPHHNRDRNPRVQPSHPFFTPSRTLEPVREEPQSNHEREIEAVLDAYFGEINPPEAVEVKVGGCRCIIS